MKEYKCICGFLTANSGSIGMHKKSCTEFLKEKQKIYEQSDLICEQYLKNPDISLLDFEYNKDLFGEINNGGITAILRDILKKNNVYDPYSKEALAAKQVKIQQTVKDRYGVINIGQLPGYGWDKQNDIPYKKIGYLTDSFEEYRKEVDRITRNTVKKIKDKPSFCEYTGILFADEEGECNPNDQRKRTVDHKIPVLICFLNDIPAEQAASITNIKFCLRYVNSVKGNTVLENFIPIALKIRKIFENEGYKSKPITAHL